jgi:hypothetical protein
MKEISKKTNTNTSSRAKISQTLKDKWKDPAFREKMINAMKQNKRRSSTTSKSQREKISAAMKKKWQDAEYRSKALKGMEEYRDKLPPRPKKQPRVSKLASTIKLDDIFMVTPMKKGAKKKRVNKSIKVNNSKAKTVKKSKTKKKKTKKSSVKLVEASETDNNQPQHNGKSSSEESDILRMREERRDLYDLLYGDEQETVVSDEEENINQVISDPLSESSNPALAFFSGMELDDENLDDFDPYGLDDV